MTRAIALTSSLGIAAALLLATVQTFADPFGLKAWWRSVASERNPYKDPDYLYEQAEEHYRNNDFAVARDISRRVLMLQPDSKAAYKLLTAIHLKNKDFRKAEETARAAARIDPDDADAQLAVGESLRGQGMTDAAAGAFQAVVESKTSEQRQRDVALEKIALLKSGPATTTGKTPPPPAPAAPATTLPAEKGRP